MTDLEKEILKVVRDLGDVTDHLLKLEEVDSRDDDKEYNQFCEDYDDHISRLDKLALTYAAGE